MILSLSHMLKIKRGLLHICQNLSNWGVTLLCCVSLKATFQSFPTPNNSNHLGWLWLWHFISISHYCYLFIKIINFAKFACVQHIHLLNFFSSLHFFRELNKIIIYILLMSLFFLSNTNSTTSWNVSIYK